MDTHPLWDVLGSRIVAVGAVHDDDELVSTGARVATPQGEGGAASPQGEDRAVCAHASCRVRLSYAHDRRQLLLTFIGRVSYGRARTANVPKGAEQRCLHTTMALNFNLVTKDDLTEMCGVGDKKARLILNALESHGAFNSYDELKATCCFIGDRHVSLFKLYGWERCEPVRCVLCGEVCPRELWL